MSFSLSSNCLPVLCCRREKVDPRKHRHEKEKEIVFPSVEREGRRQHQRLEREGTTTVRNRSGFFTARLQTASNKLATQTYLREHLVVDVNKTCREDAECRGDDVSDRSDAGRSGTSGRIFDARRRPAGVADQRKFAAVKSEGQVQRQP